MTIAHNLTDSQVNAKEAIDKENKKTFPLAFDITLLCTTNLTR